MRKIALGIAALAVATLTLSGCALAKPSAPTDPTAVRQGTPVSVRGMTVNVVDMFLNSGVGLPSERVTAATPRGMWLVLKLHVQNDGGEQQDFDATSQTLIVDGRRYSADFIASADFASAYSDRTNALLNPGLADDVMVAYDVPATPDHSAALEVKVGFMGPPAYIQLTGTPGKPS